MGDNSEKMYYIYRKLMTGGENNTPDKDEDIIDVTGQSVPVNKKEGMATFLKKVPEWPDFYVYSFSEINLASDEQRTFYQYFKARFLSGEFTDLEGSLNYAFILLFDLINEYNHDHHNLTLLEKQLKALGYYYPKTQKYGERFLLQKKGAPDYQKNTSGITKTQEGQSYSPPYSYATDHSLGSIYQKQLQLSTEQVIILNRTPYPNNSFCAAPFCREAVVKLFVAATGRLDEYYKQKGSSLADMFETIASLIARKQHNYHPGRILFSRHRNEQLNKLYEYVFKFCENAVRECYQTNKRKLSIIPANIPETQKAWEENLLFPLSNILKELIVTVPPPDAATEILLNRKNPLRWKIRYKVICLQYEDDPEQFTAETKQLGSLNKKNESGTLLYFEASKFIARKNRKQSLLFYIDYLNWELRTEYPEPVTLPKIILQILFPEVKQLEAFNTLISAFIHTRDLETAYQSADILLNPQRKKIQLDKKAIDEIQMQHSETVEILNTYLEEKEENEEENEPVTGLPAMQPQPVASMDSKVIKSAQSTPSTDINSQPEQPIFRQAPFPATSSEIVSFYIDKLPFSPVQEKLLRLFRTNGLFLSTEETENFARTNGLFKNRLINDINETCYEHLDDLLIEETEEGYSIEQDYYQSIIVRNER